MSEPLARRKFWQIVEAVEYCHARRIVHRDLKVNSAGKGGGHAECFKGGLFALQGGAAHLTLSFVHKKLGDPPLLQSYYAHSVRFPPVQAQLGRIGNVQQTLVN